VAETLVLGLGNILLGDEGVGVRVVERLLEQYDLPRSVRGIDGGTLGMALLPYVEEASHLVLVDAVQANRAPGTLFRLVGDEIPGFLQEPRISSHQTSLNNLVTAAMLQGYLPEDVVLWGAQIESVAVGLVLSPSVAAQVDVLVENVLAELAHWGITPQRRAG
jgi:hydrogenase maturation protease